MLPIVKSFDARERRRKGVILWVKNLSALLQGCRAGTLDLVYLTEADASSVEKIIFDSLAVVVCKGTTTPVVGATRVCPRGECRVGRRGRG